MIPEYRLIRSLINVDANKELKQAIKSSAKTINYKHRKKLYKFVSTVNETVVFNHVIALHSNLNNYHLDSYYANLISFNFIIAGLMPIFDYQQLSYKHYDEMQKALQVRAFLNPNIDQWYQESKTPEARKINPDLNPLLKNSRIPNTVKERVLALTHISGKIFETLKNTDYNFGYYLMLFYLITLETKQTWILKSDTNWNLKFYFPFEDFFSYKLMIIEKFSKILMENEGQNFNLYFRVINSFINKNAD